MNNNDFTEVEKHFFLQSGIKETTTKISYIPVDHLPPLGMLTALRFLEWVAVTPEGVIRLPTGKTPEYFIRWTQYLLEHWADEGGKEIREGNGL